MCKDYLSDLTLIIIFCIGKQYARSSRSLVSAFQTKSTQVEVEDLNPSDTTESQLSFSDIQTKFEVVYRF